MTITQLQEAIDTNFTPTGSDKITAAELRTVMGNIKDELLARGITIVADTTALAALSGANYKAAIVESNGVFKWLSSGTANGTTIFSAAGGGTWNRVISVTGGAYAIDDLTDVSVTSPTTGQVLKWNGTAWVNDTDATGGGGGGAATSLVAGTAPTQVGTLLSETFPGTSLSGTNWTGGLPTGATVNNKLIIASGASDWSRFIKLAKLYLYEKADWVFDFKAVTKAAGDAWGLHQDTGTFLLLYSASIYLKVDLSNGVDSGRVSIGSTTAANEYGYAQPLAFSAGDNLRLTIRRTPWKTVTILENLTTPATPKAYGEFDLQQWGTQGYVRLTFLGGQQEFTSVSIASRMRNFGGTKGVIFAGDSVVHGSGATDVHNRWTNVLMKGQQHLFENVGVGAWLIGTWNTHAAAEVLNAIDAKYLVLQFSGNDVIQATNLTTFESSIDTAVTYAQSLGYTVIIFSIAPFSAGSAVPYNTRLQTVATNRGCKYVDIYTALVGTGTAPNQNYIADGIHYNNLGQKVWAEAAAKQVPELYADIFSDINNGDVVTHNLPLGLSNDDLVTIDVYGKHRRTSRKNVTDNLIRLQPTLYETQSGSAAISGDFVNGGFVQQKSNSGLRIGFNNGAYDNNGTNIIVTNAGVGGTGFPQLFNNVTGGGNIILFAGANAVAKANSAGQISGVGNIAINTTLGNSSNWAGDGNIQISSKNTFFTTAQRNIGIGEESGGALTTGSFHIALTNRLNYNGPGTAGWCANNAEGTIILGTPWDYTGAETLASGEVVISSYSRGSRIYNFGPKGGIATNVIWRPGYTGGTNTAGYDLIIQGSRGVGNVGGGPIIFQIAQAGASGSAANSSFTEKFRITNAGIKTEQPSASGAGDWKLGKLVTAAVTADTTRYVEVSVDGVVYKLIVAA